MKKIIDTSHQARISLIIGTALEWLEFTLFAYFSTQISNLFFPKDSLFWAQMKTYFIFATSYLVRPFGAILFGYIGDRIGRKPALVYSISIMSIATCSIGLIPPYEKIGGLSTLLLIALRVTQGICVAGEFNGSNVVLVENYGKRTPFRAGLWTPLAASMGMTLGSLFASLFQSFPSSNYMWRIPFIFCGLGGFVGLFLRRKMEESMEFKKSMIKRKKITNPLNDALFSSPASFLLCMTAGMLVSNFVYLGGIYSKSLMIKIGQHHLVTANLLITIGQCTSTYLIWFFGKNMDTFDVEKSLKRFVFFIFFFSVPMIILSTQKNILFLLMAQIIYSIGNGGLSAIIMTFITLKFKNHCRYTGTSLAWSLSSAFFGGTSLVLGETLTQMGYYELIGIYLSISALVFLFALRFYENRNSIFSIQRERRA